MITNNSVEFFSDTTNTDRIYLASPASLGMNFTISMTGERLRALTPISSFQVDQGYDPAYGMQPEPYYHQEFMQQPELDYHQEVMQQPQMVPNTMYIAILSHPAYYTQEWAPMPVQQYPTAEPFDQGTQAVWPTDVSSPAPVQASYNNPVPLPTQPYTDSQHISPAPVQASYSNPVSLPTQSYTDAQHVTSQPAPEQKSTESTTPQADQLSKSPSEDSTTTQSTPDDESSSEEEEEEEYIPRPPNAFMIYRSFHCHQVQRAVLGIHNSRICKPETDLISVWTTILTLYALSSDPRRSVEGHVRWRETALERWGSSRWCRAQAPVSELEV